MACPSQSQRPNANTWKSDCRAPRFAWPIPRLRISLVIQGEFRDKNKVGKRQIAMSDEERKKREKEQEDTRLMWGCGALVSGLLWLIGRAFEWAFGPSEPGFWWKLICFLYVIGFWIIVFCQIGWLGWQTYRNQRTARIEALSDPSRETKSEARPGAWEWFIAWFILCPIGIAILVALAGGLLYGVYLYVLSIRDQFLDLIASA